MRAPGHGQELLLAAGERRGLASDEVGDAGLRDDLANPSSGCRSARSRCSRDRTQARTRRSGRRSASRGPGAACPITRLISRSRSSLVRRPCDAHGPVSLAAVRVRDQPVDRADERALAAAGRSGHQEHLARLDAEGQVANGWFGRAPVSEGQVVDLDQRRVGHRFRRARSGPACRGSAPAAPPRIPGRRRFPGRRSRRPRRAAAR